MKEVIINIETITSATGWYFDTNQPQAISDYEPVACFALVTTHDIDNPNLTPTKRIIGVSIESSYEIVGSFLESNHTDLIHESEIKSLLID